MLAQKQHGLKTKLAFMKREWKPKEVEVRVSGGFAPVGWLMAMFCAVVYGRAQQRIVVSFGRGGCGIQELGHLCGKKH